MNILITICARGGSKGVKNKNIRPLMGQPLIAYTINQAKNWGRSSDIVVSTDSQEIATVAKQYGALVPFLRPDHLASDTAAKVPVIRHALMECEKIYQKKYDLVVDLDTTSPIRDKNDLENCYQKFVQTKPQLLFSVVPAHRNPYFNMVEDNNEGFAKLCKQLPTRVTRRQDAPRVYDMNASIYFYDRNFLLREDCVEAFFEKSVSYEMNELSGFDIDREIDFTYMEFLIKEGLVTL